MSRVLSELSWPYFATLVALTISPPLLMVWVIAEIDYFREPRRVVWTTFLLSAAAAPLVLGVDMLLVDRFDLSIVPVQLLFDEPSASGWARGWLWLISGVIVFAFVEELLKLGVFRLYAARSTHFDERMDGLVYGACAGLGFGVWENIHYAVTGSLYSAFHRAVLCAPFHGLLGALIGYYVGKAVLARRGVWRASLLATGATTILHASYNFSLGARLVLSRHEIVSEGTANLIGYTTSLLAVGLWIWLGLTLRRERRAQVARHEAGETLARPPALFARRHVLVGVLLELLGLVLIVGAVVFVFVAFREAAFSGSPSSSGIESRLRLQISIEIAPIALAGLLCIHGGIRKLRGGPV